MDKFKKQSPSRDFYIEPSEMSEALRIIVETPELMEGAEDDTMGSLYSTLTNDPVAQTIMQEVLKTDYFQGLKSGTLSPNDYGCLCVEDAYFCFKGADNYATAAENSTIILLSEFLGKKAESYKDHTTYYNCPWHIHDAESVLPGEAIQNYVDYADYVATSLDPVYTLVMMLPCEYLWWWVATQLNPEVGQDNVYRCWVDSNYATNPSGANQMGAMIDSFYKSDLISVNKALEIYRSALSHELLVFTNATLDQSRCME